MKKIIYSLLIAFTASSMVFAQVDRTKPPKPLAAREINFGKVETFTLKNGLNVIVVENHKLPKVRVDLSLDVNGFREGNKAGLGSMFGDMFRAGTKKYTKEQLDEKIDFLGIDLFAGNSNLGFSSLKKQLTPSLEIMQDILFNSTFSNQEVLDKLKKQAKTSLDAGEKNPDVISNRVQGVLLYGKDDAWGEYETAQTIDNITLADFKKHYDTYFKPNIAYLTFVGDITSTEAKKIAESYFGKWEAGEVKTSLPPLKKTAKGVKIAFVDLPSATQSSIDIMGLINLKKTSPEYFPSTLGNSILGGGSFGRLFKNIREKHGWTYGAYSSLNDSDKRLGSFSASAKVRNNVTDSATVEFIKEIKTITSVAPTAEELNTKKAEYNGNFAMGLERPETVARFIRTQMVQELPNDFYKNYLKNINAVTANQIPTSLKNVIDPEDLTILIVGKAEEVLPGLEKLGYPIQYFDKFGNPTEKPAAKKEVTGVTAQQVIDKYITAIAGSRANLEKVKTLQADTEMNVPQMPNAIPVVMKQMVPNKVIRIISIMGQTMKEGFDGEKAFSSMRQVSEEESTQLKNVKGIFAELYYKPADLTLDGIVKTENGSDAYKIIITENGEKSVSYFDVKTGLKVKEEQSQEGNTVVTENSEYKDFGGIKFPAKISMNGGMTITVKNITINPMLSDSDFKQ